ncbi:hypothetical protein D9611_000410 [Ephemerocybe angulata]|uniref:Uncharacterized protein n=1 Tax=Ephemerocybe angulata TaxID=980116 RepID=A0A8H5BN89_9AGAR|nr:hypothetical protein D9611_000410 [Tulosesus angulatus]
MLRHDRSGLGTTKFLTNRRQWMLGGICFLTVGFLLYRWSLFSSGDEVEVLDKSTPTSVTTAVGYSQKLDVLNYPHPTDTFRANLRSDQYYVTAWATGGFTNEFLSYVHLLYLAFVSERVPILPPFIADAHITWGTGPVDFGEIFNISALETHLKRPILEWSDVKTVQQTRPSTPEFYSYTNNHTERIGCWSTRARHEAKPAGATRHEGLLGFDASYTRVPNIAYKNPDRQDDPNVMFHALAATIAVRHPYPTSDLPLMAASPSGSKLRPDEHLACYDFLYYATSGITDYEWKYPWSPEWRVIGVHLPFTDRMIDLATKYLRTVYSKELTQSGLNDLPPLITVHIRRGDFTGVGQCSNDKPCRTGTELFAKAVDEVKKQLAEERGLQVPSVFITSDEKEPLFWDEISALGWRFINHTAEKTLDRYGEWYPPLIDTVALSLGVGFVGTLDSTFSTLSARRVEDWNRGAIRLVDRRLT